MIASQDSLLQRKDVRDEQRFSGRIVYFVNDTTFFLSHRLPIARAAKAAGLEVHVATPTDSAVVKLQSEGFYYHPVPVNRWRANPIQEAATLLAIRRVLQRVRPDILHNVTIKPVLYGSVAARSYPQVRVVNAISGLGTVFIRRGIGAAVRRKIVASLYRRLLRRSGVCVILQNSDDLATFVKRRIIEKNQAVLIRGSGADLTQFSASPLPKGTAVVMLASRMLWDKGVDEFVRAAEKLRANRIAGRFVLVGDSEFGNPAAVPAIQLKNWAQTGVVEWWGHREDMPKVLAEASVVCLPSYREGLPKVLLEAASCGRPLIATDVPGCREIVRHRVNGLLVPLKDADALANAICEVLHDRQRAEEMGERSREIAEAEFGVETVVDQTLRVYEGLLQRGAA